MTALVIDDSRAMRSILGRILAEHGFEILEATHGLEALELLRGTTSHPAVALVDWTMPEMNGLDFVKAVRAEHSYDDIRLMMVTSESETNKVSAALAAGADEYVMKPFTREVIAEKLQLVGFLKPAVPAGA